MKKTQRKTKSVSSIGRTKGKAKDKPVVFTGLQQKAKHKYLTVREYVLLTKDEQNKYLKSFPIDERKELGLWYLTQTLSVHDFGTPFEEVKLGDKKYLKKIKDERMLEFYDEYWSVRPTPEYRKKEAEEKELERQMEEAYKIAHYCDPLTDAQFYTICVQTPSGGIPMYMGKPLGKDNLRNYEHWKKTSKQYKNYLETIERVKKLRKHIEKPFDQIKKNQEKILAPIKNLLESQKEVMDKLKSSNFAPDLEFLGKWRKLPNPFGAGIGAYEPIDATAKGLLSGGVGEHGLSKGHGLNEYIENNNLKSKFDLPKHYIDQWKKDKTKIGYYVESYGDVEALAESLGVIPLELFQILCHHIIKVREKLEKQDFAKDLFKIELLVAHFDREKYHRKEKKMGDYTLTDLFNSKFFKEWCVTHNATKWFTEVKPKTGYNRLQEVWKDWVKICKSETNQKIMAEIDTAIDLHNDSLAGK